MDILIVALAPSIALALYLMPAVIAFRRRHANAVPIMLLTVFLGWTLAGWLAALIWSFTSNVRRPAPPPAPRAQSPYDEHVPIAKAPYHSVDIRA